MNKITEEEINRILLSSPMVLPANPSASGLKGENIKSLFYKFIRVFAQILNTHIEGLQNETISRLDSHNALSVAHADIRALIDNLQERDTELGDSITAQILNHNESTSAHNDIRSRLTSDIREHNQSTDAHSFLQTWLNYVEERANEAYNLAAGRSKIIPVKDVYEMMSSLHPDLNVGDRFILSDQNVPDFTLFEKNSTSAEATELSTLGILMGLKIEPGKSYICNGYLLVASESGIDTALFAKAAELKSLMEVINLNKAESEQRALELEKKLLTKETKKTLVSESAETVVLAADTEFNLGLRTSVILALPEQVPNEFEVIINFRSGESATVFDAPSSIIFTQDDSYGGVLTPISNRIYEINIKNVGGVLIAKVGSCDYEVIE